MQISIKLYTDKKQTGSPIFGRDAPLRRTRSKCPRIILLPCTARSAALAQSATECNLTVETMHALNVALLTYFLQLRQTRVAGGGMCFLLARPSTRPSISKIANVIIILEKKNESI